MHPRYRRMLSDEIILTRAQIRMIFCKMATFAYFFFSGMFFAGWTTNRWDVYLDSVCSPSSTFILKEAT